jgi:hypothetical protein
MTTGSLENVATCGKSSSLYSRKRRRSVSMMGMVNLASKKLDIIYFAHFNSIAKGVRLVFIDFMNALSVSFATFANISSFPPHSRRFMVADEIYE